MTTKDLLSNLTVPTIYPGLCLTSRSVAGLDITSFGKPQFHTISGQTVYTVNTDITKTPQNV